MLHYCKKCGRTLINTWKVEILNCDCCKSITFPVPEQYLYDGCDTAFKNEESEKLLIEEIVKTSPEFDPYLFEHREEILAQKHAKFNAAMEHGKAIIEGRDKGNSYGVQCPYCHATNIKKITTVSRSASFSLFGFGSSKVGKQWHCNKCKSDF